MAEDPTQTTPDEETPIVEEAVDDVVNDESEEIESETEEIEAAVLTDPEEVEETKLVTAQPETVSEYRTVLDDMDLPTGGNKAALKKRYDEALLSAEVIGESMEIFEELTGKEVESGVEKGDSDEKVFDGEDIETDAELDVETQAEEIKDDVETDVEVGEELDKQVQSFLDFLAEENVPTPPSGAYSDVSPTNDDKILWAVTFSGEYYLALDESVRDWKPTVPASDLNVTDPNTPPMSVQVRRKKESAQSQ